MRPDGTGQRPLVTEAKVEGTFPAWSPDGTRISFLGWLDDGSLYVVDADGRNLGRVAGGTRDTGTNEWRPDGRRIMFERGGLERNNGLWVVRSDGSDVARLALRVSSPDWSPGGRRIAFIRKSKIYVMKSNGTAAEDITASAESVVDLDW